MKSMLSIIILLFIYISFALISAFCQKDEKQTGKAVATVPNLSGENPQVVNTTEGHAKAGTEDQGDKHGAQVTVTGNGSASATSQAGIKATADSNGKGLQQQQQMIMITIQELRLKHMTVEKPKRIHQKQTLKLLLLDQSRRQKLMQIILKVMVKQIQMPAHQVKDPLHVHLRVIRKLNQTMTALE